MTATEKLRSLLDERGVEWEEVESCLATGITRFRAQNGVWMRYVDYDVYQWFDDDEDGSLTPEQAITATLGDDNSDTVKRLMELQGGHYSWPTLYEAVTGDPFDYHCPPSKGEEVFIERLISIVGGRKVVGE